MARGSRQFQSRHGRPLPWSGLLGPLRRSFLVALGSLQDPRLQYGVTAGGRDPPQGYVGFFPITNLGMKNDISATRTL